MISAGPRLGRTSVCVCTDATRVYMALVRRAPYTRTDPQPHTTSHPPPHHAAGDKERRPFMSSDCDNLQEAEKWRREIIKESTRKIAEIQNGA